ncbi:MAG: flagellar biosynthesis protein FlhB [Gammaproteobacteria bacterium]|jgi:flagellar biosynthetic protein FlhB
MADEQSYQEKTEQATPKRLRDAREKGQVPRSRELSAALVMTTGGAMMVMAHGPMTASMLNLIRRGLSTPGHMSKDPAVLPAALGEALGSALIVIAPFLLVLLAAAVLAPTLTGGWSFSLKPLAPKLEKLDPVKGLKRVFGPKGLIELVKAFAKAMLVTGLAVALLWRWAPELLALGAAPVGEAIGASARMAGSALLLLSISLILIAAIDVPFQLWQHARQLRMTRQEVRDEMKETDGRPEVKSRIRSLQQEFARRRMLQDVPTADVVITNPTHFAVALKYDEQKMRAPTVVAKGADLVAARIRDLASEHRVALFEAPPLARALYRSTDIGHEIPARLYAAVAQILTWVYRVRRARVSGELPPSRPEVEVDEDEVEQP